jgi:hypothetical protein
MSRTIQISDELYTRLEKEAQMRGLSIESLIEEWERNESELRLRQTVVDEIGDLRDRLFAKYGQMPDSIEFLREDRNNR